MRCAIKFFLDNLTSGRCDGILGFAGIGFMAYRGKSKPALMAA